MPKPPNYTGVIRDQWLQGRQAIVAGVIGDVAELPDRTSPEDEPDMMLVTMDELRIILERHLSLD